MVALFQKREIFLFVIPAKAGKVLNGEAGHLVTENGPHLTLDPGFRRDDVDESNRQHGMNSEDGIDVVQTRQPCVYLLASKRNGTLYVGVTSNLPARVWHHRNDSIEGFTRRYKVHDLVWFEAHENMESAIVREKLIKAWKRSWKIELIENSNPYWRDLYPDICV